MVKKKDELEELWIGRDKKGKGVKLNPGGMLRHHAVIGQSGSGKSFMIGRLIEEMVLHTFAKIIILDLNADFGRLGEVNQKVWDAGTNSKLFQNLLGEEYDLDASSNNFTNRWQAELGDPLFITAVPEEKHNLKISWEKLSEPELRQLLGIVPFERPEATWLLELLTREAEKSRWKFGQWRDVGSNVVSWRRGLSPKDEESERLFGRLQRHIHQTVSDQTAQQLAIALRDAFNYGIWNEGQKPTCFDELFENSPRSTNNLPRVMCLNLASLSGEHARLFVVRYVLERLWQVATEERWQAITGHKNNDRKPVYIVVDEVHRLAPQEAEGAAEKGVLEVMRRIAAEGRKQGLFLIVATQRPSKLHSDILSECDNVCVMRLVSSVDIDLLKKRLSFGEPEKLQDAKGFVRGKAIFGGQWVKGDMVQVHQVATRRTVESGGDLPLSNFVR